jgi:two-component system phosphate regulon sensor histidine kinase PhoR
MLIYVLSFVMWSAAAAGLGWWWGGLQEAALMAWGASGLWALVQLWRAHRLEKWFRTGPVGEPPRLAGVWREISDRIRRLLRNQERQVRLHAERLQHFLDAIEASPNGVTLLDQDGRIVWCNATAGQHLGIDAVRDRLQHVVHLVRDPVFTRYVQLPEHGHEVVIEGRSPSLSKSLKLSVQLHPYGEGQQLLLTRDITALSQADAMRRDFVANVSHEIRTPLTVLSGFVETLQSLDLPATEQQRYLGLMGVQARRMQSLVSDLLILSQLEGSPPPGHAEQVPLELLMSQLESDARALSAMQGGVQESVHALVFGAAPDMALQGARSELQSALSNLVSNAVRYTPAGGRIEVDWCEQGGNWLFAVRDSGPGIAAEHLPRLAERFYRVDRSRSRESGGTGLGLAITKHVMQRHGGELRIESQLGVGSCFMLVFPAHRLIRLTA